MLAVVKKPHIELSITGEHVQELLSWIKRKFDVQVLSDTNVIPIRDTEWHRAMRRNHNGKLLLGARTLAGLSQVELAAKIGVKQNVISDYEKGKRELTLKTAHRLAKEIKFPVDQLQLD